VKRQNTQDEILEHVEYEQSLNDVRDQQRLRLYSSGKKLPSARKNISTDNRRKNSIHVQHLPRQGGSSRKELQDQSNNQTPIKSQEPASFYLAPKSLRISYEEGGHLSHGQKFQGQAFNKENLFREDPRMVAAGNVRSLSDLKKLKKEDLKVALNDEIDRRMQLEKQMEVLQAQFLSFKKDVGVDQMKQVLADSQQEYQKLYDICVMECEKGAKMGEQCKKEKRLREEREN